VVTEDKAIQPNTAWDKRQQDILNKITPRIDRWAIDLLKEIQTIAPEAHIAGGLLRDLACNKDIEPDQIKDIDIFLPLYHESEEDSPLVSSLLPYNNTIWNRHPHPHLSIWETVKNMVMRSHPIINTVYFSDHWYYGPDERGVDMIMYCRSPIEGVLPLNLIFLDPAAMPPFGEASKVTVEKVIADFDFGLCQIGFDGERIHTTEAFWKDLFSIECTLTRCLGWWDYERSMERFERFKKKIPFLRLKFAPSLRQYEFKRSSLEHLRREVYCQTPHQNVATDPDIKVDHFGRLGQLAARLGLLDVRIARRLQDPEESRIMTPEELAEFSTIHWEAGRVINPDTAEVRARFRNELDPYGILPKGDDDLFVGGKVYFASDGSDIWVAFQDLPKMTRDALISRVTPQVNQEEAA
jgi:hypothetical protein